ncbi:ABC transporter ATP-binding protein [candidate division KSB1 bacterium]|nr:ABC transporter ATP-binding protein [candidate division KSB1 bacterium]
MPPALLEIHNLFKSFGNNRVLDDVSLQFHTGEIHAVLGENGAGKSTLMNLIYGLLQPDNGAMQLEGRVFAPRSPRDAIRASLGMVHQHFMLVPTFTVLENFLLGNPRFRMTHAGLQSAEQEVQQLCARLHIELDTGRRVHELAVGQQQRVEIIKILLRAARLLILDEPTAVLAPQEVEELFALLRVLREQGHAIIFISHKLEEVKAISDRVTVLRAGKVTGEFETHAVTTAEIAHAITPNVSAPTSKRVASPTEQKVLLQAEALCARNSFGGLALDHVSFTLRSSEVLGVAGVDGNGQAELAEALMGLRKLESGKLRLEDWDCTAATTLARVQNGFAHIPADRREMGLFPGLTIYENAAIFAQREREFQTRGWLHMKRIKAWSQRLVQAFDVRTDDMALPVETLSGGNQQKLVVGRELMRQPKVLVAVNPTRGVDLAATQKIHELLLAEKARGAAILLISTELEEIYALADRIAVLFKGRMLGPFAASEPRERIGASMLGAKI